MTIINQKKPCICKQGDPCNYHAATCTSCGTSCQGHPAPFQTLEQFYVAIQGISKVSRMRYGQAAFNLLFEISPELANQVRATDKDPFYADSLDDPRWLKFIAFLEANWDAIKEEAK